MSASVAYVWGPDDDEELDRSHQLEITVAGHQFSHEYVHVWLDAVDGPKIATLDLTIDDAEQLVTRLTAEIALKKKQIKEQNL